MLTLNGKRGVRFCDGLTRRDFLRAGALSAGALGLSLTELTGRPSDREMNCILLFLVGGPSHLDTWDLKPKAPSNIRGPFRPIPTNVPGVSICEHFPRMAGMAERYALVRSVHHTAAPIHETGHQLMQTGHLFHNNEAYPHYGSVLSHLRGQRAGGMPPFVVLPSAIDNTGVSVSHGQTAGSLGRKHEPLVLRSRMQGDNLQITDVAIGAGDSWADEQVALALDEADRRLGDDAQTKLAPILTPRVKQAFALRGESSALRSRYGATTFGQSCMMARRLIEQGVRLVTVNMFDTVFNQVTWDCHADGGSLPSSLDDYKEVLCPMFDQAYSALLDDLHQRGLLQNTMVIAMGEFGRTPQLNPRGGRDHWPGVWTVLFAGGPFRGGQVIGASDWVGAEPKDRPISPAEIAATIYQGLGIDRRTCLPIGEGRSIVLSEAEPIQELLS